MGFFKMKKGMVFVMLTLFGSCVYTGTFFYLNLIEDSEGMSVHFLFAAFYFILSSLRFRSSVRDKYDVYRDDSIKLPPFNNSSPIEYKCFQSLKTVPTKTSLSSVHHALREQAIIPREHRPIV